MNHPQIAAIDVCHIDEVIRVAVSHAVSAIHARPGSPIQVEMEGCQRELASLDSHGDQFAELLDTLDSKRKAFREEYGTSEEPHFVDYRMTAKDTECWMKAVSTFARQQELSDHGRCEFTVTLTGISEKSARVAIVQEEIGICFSMYFS